MADLRISELPALAGAAAASADVIPVTDVSASQTKKIQIKDLIEYGVDLIDDNSIPQDKIDLSAFVLPDNIVSALKLTDNSSGVVGSGLPAAGDRIGQVAVNTADNKLYVWGGGAWLEIKAAGSINSVTGDATGLVLVTVTQAGDVVTLNSTLANTTAARQFLAGPTTGGGAISQRVIVPGDLPAATTADKGAVTVGSGLSVTAGGGLSLANVTTEQTALSLSTWDIHGAVTGGRPIEPGDLPLASATAPGIVQPTGSLTVGPGGALQIISGVVGGEYTKVTVNNEGLVTLGALLNADDIPNIDADKIASGTFDTERLADDSVTSAKIRDYATCLIQEDNPGGSPEFPLGLLWFRPSTATLSVFARGSGSANMWMAIGLQGLTGQQLRWGGTYDATSGNVVTTTAIGGQAGLTASTPVPTATDNLSGIYLLCITAGDAMTIPNLTGVTHTVGDWIYCISQTAGWAHADVTSGGGGGGGATRLNDLVDVEVGSGGSPALTTDQLLNYDGTSGLWRNNPDIDGGTID